MTAEDVIDLLGKEIIKIKAVFLTADYDDDMHGWIVEDHLIHMQEIINEYRNKEFKRSEPDPFA